MIRLGLKTPRKKESDPKVKNNHLPDEVIPLINTLSLSKGYLNFEAKAGGEVRIFGFYKNKQTEREVVSCLPYPSGRHHRLIFGLPIFATNLVRGLANNEMPGPRDWTTDVARQHDTGRPQDDKNSGGLNPVPGEHTCWAVLPLVRYVV